jgi:3-dehydroquinate dehydratase-2
MKLIIINGPNLNLLGNREPNIYGSQSFESFFQSLQQQFGNAIELSYFQNNAEGAIIDKIHEVGFSYHGIILNGGAYTHTSIAIADAIAAVETPVIEVHISNVYARETFRQHSYFSAYCKGVIVGMGLQVYTLAILSFILGRGAQGGDIKV